MQQKQKLVPLENYFIHPSVPWSKKIEQHWLWGVEFKVELYLGESASPKVRPNHSKVTDQNLRFKNISQNKLEMSVESGMLRRCYGG